MVQAAHESPGDPVTASQHRISWPETASALKIESNASRPTAATGVLDDRHDRRSRLDPEIAGGAPPDDLGTPPPHVDFDDDAYDDDDDELEADSVGREHLGHGAGDVATPPVTRKGGLARVPGFIRACWAELQRVQWPDRRQVGQATAVVLGFVVIAGAFLGLADVIAQQIVDLIL